MNTVKATRNLITAITLATACIVTSTNALYAQGQTIWLPVSPQGDSHPRTPVKVDGPVEVTLSDGSKHALMKAEFGIRDKEYCAEMLQMSQAEYDSLFSLPINTLSEGNPAKRLGECFYSVLIPIHTIKRIESQKRHKGDLNFPVVVTFRDAQNSEIVCDIYQSGTQHWGFLLTGTESLGGFGDKVFRGYMRATDDGDSEKFTSITLPELPAAPEPRERSKRSALIVDISSKQHLLRDIRMPDKLVCQSVGGTVDVPLDKVASLSAVRTKDSETQLVKTVWSVKLKSGETRDFSSIGIFGIAGRGERFFECIPYDSISTVDFTATPTTNKAPAEVGNKH